MIRAIDRLIAMIFLFAPVTAFIMVFFNMAIAGIIFLVWVGFVIALGVVTWITAVLVDIWRNP